MKKLSLSFIVNLLCFYCISQNVGIGTATPTKGKLEIVGAAGAGNTCAIFGSNSTGISIQQSYPAIGFNEYGDNVGAYSKYISDGYASLLIMDAATGALKLHMLGNGLADTYTNTDYKPLTISSIGNVGIRSEGNTASLTVGRGTGSDGSAIIQGTSYWSHFDYGTLEDTYIRAGKPGSTVYINDLGANAHVSIAPAATSVISLGTSNSRVGVNVAAPEFPFQVQEFRDATGNDKGILIADTYGSEWELRNSTSFFWMRNGSEKAYIDPANGSWHGVSDRRLKKNIHQLPSVMDKIMKLEPVEYDMVNEPPGKDPKIGFIAQDVKVLFPDLVSVIDNKNNAMGYKNIPDLHMMDYSGFGVLAIKAVQEQQTEITELKKRMEVLEQQNKELLSLLKK